MHCKVKRDTLDLGTKREEVHLVLAGNEELRSLCRRKRVPLWAVARVEGVSEYTLIRRMRIELPEAEKTRLVAVIECIARDGFQ